MSILLVDMYELVRIRSRAHIRAPARLAIWSAVRRHLCQCRTFDCGGTLSLHGWVQSCAHRSIAPAMIRSSGNCNTSGRWSGERSAHS